MDNSETVTRADVIACYKYLLGREPENEETILWHQQRNGSVVQLVDSFVKNGEFAGRFGVFRTGMYLDANKFDVRLDATERQIETLLDRTAATWRELGAEEPHWSVITDPSFRSGNINDNLTQFYATGKDQIELIGALLERNNLSFRSVGTCLDFGCGVGRLTLPLAQRHSRTIGVDISKAHITQAEQAAKIFNINNVAFQDINSVADIDNLPTCGLLVSLIVLQHNPPPIMCAMLQKLLGRLEPRGVAVFQLPIFKADYSFSVEEYLKTPRSHDMEMHPLPPRYVFKAIADAGCSVLEVREDLHAYMVNMVSQTFLVQRKS
jgi:2-polyprenyl-3-methyl-5-hydroxy-6-metoxy-1,4-benzoquinol methylase